eukprot:5767219-Prymnesium_polylepis.1
MHWESHCEAFYAQWIVRYLHPRKAPWKTILRHWITAGEREGDDDSPHGLGDAILLAPAPVNTTALDHIPSTAKYARRCVASFLSLRMQQNYGS